MSRPLPSRQRKEASKSAWGHERRFGGQAVTSEGHGHDCDQALSCLQPSLPCRLSCCAPRQHRKSQSAPPPRFLPDAPKQLAKPHGLERGTNTTAPRRTASTTRSQPRALAYAPASVMGRIASLEKGVGVTINTDDVLVFGQSVPEDSACGSCRSGAACASFTEDIISLGSKAGPQQLVGSCWGHLWKQTSRRAQVRSGQLRARRAHCRCGQMPS